MLLFVRKLEEIMVITEPIVWSCRSHNQLSNIKISIHFVTFGFAVRVFLWVSNFFLSPTKRPLIYNGARKL